MDSYIESQDTCIKRNREVNYFRFGPSQVYKSEVNYEIDVKFGNFEEKMIVSVVEANIPLLIGLDYQKSWGMVLDVSKDKVYMKKFDKTLFQSASLALCR